LPYRLKIMCVSLEEKQKRISLPFMECILLTAVSCLPAAPT
jgi:hypothetical protein